MAAKNPRLKDLIEEPLEYCEDAYWAKEADKRERTLHKKSALSHKEVYPKAIPRVAWHFGKE